MAFSRRSFLASSASFAAIPVLAAAQPRSRIVVVKPHLACPAAERVYGALLAKHVVRWLATGNVAADVADDRNLESALSGRALAFLPLCSTPNADQLAALRRFVARGGKLFVFYSHSSALAEMMGMKLVGSKRPAPGTYADVRFRKGAPAGAPAHFAQSSPLACLVAPVPGRSVAIAQWANRDGAEWADVAVLASSAGWWMTHVLMADGDEEAKAQFLLSVVGAAVPGAWSVAAWNAKKNAALAADRAYAASLPPRAGEIRAVWDQSGQGLYPGDWPRTMRILAAAKITDLYVNVAGAGFAHYPSKVLPQSASSLRLGDQLAACLAAARGSGIRVHAWVICFNATHATPARLAAFAKKGWRLKHRETGALTEYLDPANAELRALLLSALGEISAKYPLHGVHVDFVRYFERARIPANASRTVASFVAQARSAVKRARPAAIFSAAVFGKYPSCVKAVGQDWEAWLDAGLVDQLVAMNYMADMEKYAGLVAQQGRTAAHARRIVSGIGVTANESRLTPRQVLDQVVVARRAGLAGVAFFDLDYFFATSVLPLLRLGLFR